VRREEKKKKTIFARLVGHRRREKRETARKVL
jgi:hypothetical protein